MCGMVGCGEIWCGVVWCSEMQCGVVIDWLGNGLISSEHTSDYMRCPCEGLEMGCLCPLLLQKPKTGVGKWYKIHRPRRLFQNCILLSCAVWHYELRHYAVLHGAVLCWAAWCCAAQHITVMCCAAWVGVVSMSKPQIWCIFLDSKFKSMHSRYKNRRFQLLCVKSLMIKEVSIY